MKKPFVRILSLILVIVMFTFAIPISASASTMLGNTKSYFTLYCDKPGYTFKVYRVADFVVTSESPYEAGYKSLIPNISSSILAGDPEEALSILDGYKYAIPDTAVYVGDFECTESHKVQRFSGPGGIYYVRAEKVPTGIKSVTNSIFATPYFDGEDWVMSTLESPFEIHLATKVLDDEIIGVKSITNSNTNNSNFTIAGYGDVIDFEIRSTITGSKQFPLKLFAMHDRMFGGLTLDDESFKVSLLNEEGEEIKELTGQVGVLPATGDEYYVQIIRDPRYSWQETNFAISLTDEFLASKEIYDLNATYISATYSATLNRFSVTGSSGNFNELKGIEYVNAWDEKALIPGNTVYVYTYSLVGYKNDENGEPLQGASFQLFETIEDAEALVNPIGEGVSDSNGIVRFSYINKDSNVMTLKNNSTNNYSIRNKNTNIASVGSEAHTIKVHTYSSDYGYDTLYMWETDGDIKNEPNGAWSGTRQETTTEFGSYTWDTSDSITLAGYDYEVGAVLSNDYGEQSDDIILTEYLYTDGVWNNNNEIWINGDAYIITARGKLVELLEAYKSKYNNGVNSGNYTDLTWDSFVYAYEYALEVVGDPYADQGMIDVAQMDLEDFYNNLKKRSYNVIVVTQNEGIGTVTIRNTKITTIKGVAQAPNGSDVDIVATAPNNYYISDISVNGESVYSNSNIAVSSKSIVIENVMTDKDVEVTYAMIPTYNIIFESYDDSMGTVFCNGTAVDCAGETITVLKKDEVRIHLEAKDGYLCNPISVNGVEESGTKEVVISNINIDQYVKASFRKAKMINVRLVVPMDTVATINDATSQLIQVEEGTMLELFTSTDASFLDFNGWSIQGNYYEFDSTSRLETTFRIIAGNEDITITPNWNETPSRYIYLDVEAGWVQPYIFFWGGKHSVEWPGIPMLYDSRSGYWYAYIPDDISDLQFNNGYDDFVEYSDVSPDLYTIDGDGDSYSGYYGRPFASAKFTRLTRDNIRLQSKKYYVVETSAPKGYNVYGKVIEVDLTAQYSDTFTNGTFITNEPEGGVASFTLYNTRLMLPVTGGTGRVVLYCASFLIAGAGFVTLCSYSRKKRKANKV